MIEWLAAHLAYLDIRVVDMRTKGFDASHIPGASHPPNSAVRDPRHPPGFLPSKEAFKALMSALGIGDTTGITAYDERGGVYAVRLWWVLQYYGHPNAALLNGSWVKREAEHRPKSADTPA